MWYSGQSAVVAAAVVGVFNNKTLNSLLLSEYLVQDISALWLQGDGINLNGNRWILIDIYVFVACVDLFKFV